MKELTAKEARDMAKKSKVASRETRSLLRGIKRAAKRGSRSLNVSYSDWGNEVAEKICENLKGLGYKACIDIWRDAIYISW